MITYGLETDDDTYLVRWKGLIVGIQGVRLRVLACASCVLTPRPSTEADR
jgi:hypothetical protein